MFIYADEILLNAEKEDVAFLVVGDPFGFVLHIILYTLHYIHCFFITTSAKQVD